MRLAAVLPFVIAASLAFGSRASAQYTLPLGFVDEPVVGGFDQPVGMTLLPDGRLLVVERTTAHVRLAVNGAIAANDPLLTVPNVNSTGGEQGLLGIAVDPGWPARPYLYVHFDYGGSANIHIARFTATGDLGFTGNGELTVSPASRFDILTTPPDNADNHNGGTLRFGPDGMLYCSLGDDASGCPALDLTVLVGKILRLDVSGLPAGPGGPPTLGAITPPDNPFVGNLDPNTRLVWASGLRNPFRFAIDPVTGSLAIGDVGLDTREEMDVATSGGRSFEWPIREGDVAGPAACPGADLGRFTGPVYVYPHPSGEAVIGGVVYRRNGGAGSFPAAYEGDIFFSDFYAPWMRRLKGAGSAWSLAPAGGQPNATDWGTGPTFVSDWLEVPDGSLLYCHMLGNSGSGLGAIRRIRYTGTAPTPPAGSLLAPFASPAVGSATLPFTLVRPARVSLTLYDIAGRPVRTLIAGEARNAGPDQAFWDGRGDDGRDAPAGIYVVRFVADGVRSERRFPLFR
ncbi:MAG: hypothetical protein E6K81_11610 [Candidatus Eisenbacteria bacterium]|uniref:T9SS type A sorting domain-containing protein n=1 Tax=Eiseniibacteriota bacterium TaxID=2212470 RepID=A0A538U4P6_UNCEI|nr:MAG: hypothetical protein E6K81_11610 [Candidatus Eisenbacteria bacterium]